MKLRRIRRGGEYCRVADPGWKNPLDGRFSREHGGRWNPPGSFPVVYLNASVKVARANVVRKLAGQPFGPEDLDPEEGPVLVTVEVPEARFVDLVTDAGCRAAGLPTTYPLDGDRRVDWERCQPVGRRAWEEGLPGIACRTAVPGLGSDDEELAWFERRRSLRRLSIRAFDEWFWPL